MHSPERQDDVNQHHLAGFHFLPKERFLYEYDLDLNGWPRWQHQVRFQRTLPVEPQRIYPVYIGDAGHFLGITERPIFGNAANGG